MSSNKIKISALGGSGENGRNCFIIETIDGAILLDCGVKREKKGQQVGFYPSLTAELVSRIKAVFLSHCHEDHTAALPLLYQLGYKGAVYASAETIEATPAFIKKWMRYVQKNNGELPFTNEMVDQIEYHALKLGPNNVEGISLTTGRSGHVLGGMWYVFNFGGKRVLYTGDITLDAAILEMDIPPECDIAIMNCAYAGKQINQKQQYAALLASIQAALAQGGKVLLPLPPKGRGIDLYLYLKEYLQNTVIYVEKSIVQNCEALLQKKQWIKSGIGNNQGAGNNVIIVENDEQRHSASNIPEGAVYLVTDGMLTTADGLYYFNRIKSDSSNKVIITGHAAEGTTGALIFDKEYCATNGIALTAEKIIFKVHLDDSDIMALNEKVKAKTIVLFHSNEENNRNLYHSMSSVGVNAMTLAYPNFITV
ncbi:MAG: MBL fold metallo-hydrolase [Firmicutes bacterium]|nr:MBL fold metallo-hydrolase [Bacillota bacterium]